MAASLFAAVDAVDKVNVGQSLAPPLSKSRLTPDSDFVLEAHFGTASVHRENRNLCITHRGCSGQKTRTGSGFRPRWVVTSS